MDNEDYEDEGLEKQISQAIDAIKGGDFIRAGFYIDNFPETNLNLDSLYAAIAVLLANKEHSNDISDEERELFAKMKDHYCAKCSYLTTIEYLPIIGFSEPFADELEDSPFDPEEDENDPDKNF